MLLLIFFCLSLKESLVNWEKEKKKKELSERIREGKKMKYLIFFVLFYGCSCVDVNWTEPVNCVGVDSTSLAGNSAALLQVIGFCTGEARCAEVTGQSITIRPALFDMILSLLDTLPPPGMINTTTPLETIVCGMTLQDINTLLWRLVIRAGICDTEASCAVDDQPFVSPVTGEISCEQLPDRESKNQFQISTVLIFFGIGLFVVLLVIAGIGCYGVSLTRRELDMKEQKMLREQQLRVR